MTTPAEPPDDTFHLTCERRFDPATPLDYIAAMLRELHSTGTLTVDFSSGGVGSVTFRERQRLTLDVSAAPASTCAKDSS